MDKIKSDYTKNNNEISLLGDISVVEPILVIGVIHGDEPQGEGLINRYLSDNESSRLWFVPCLNPDGRDLESRTNANGVDINRNFPTKNWVLSKKDKYFGGVEPNSEIETRFLVDVIARYSPRLILTLHTPYKIVNFDGPARDIAEEISRIIGYPVEESIGYPTPGSFGTFVGVEREIPVITLEMDEEKSVEELYPQIREVFYFLENINSSY